MQITLQIIITEKGSSTHIEDLLELHHSDTEDKQPGLSIDDSKQLLSSAQQVIMHAQAKDYMHHHRNCPHCGKPRRIKGYQTRKYRTLFGVIPVTGTRLYRCACEQSTTKTSSLMSEWLPEQSHPELRYLEVKWASLMSYGLTVDRLKDILPIGHTLNAATVRNNVSLVAKLQEAELTEQPAYLEGCPHDWGQLSKPGKPMIMGFDGGYVRNCRDRKTNFEVITGKSYSEQVEAKRFGYVQTLEVNPRRRMMALLSSQGMQANQQITFLSDGADNLRAMQLRMYPEAEHVLDWFHVTMRLTVLNQYAKGLIQSDPAVGTELSDLLESTKWYLWHGNVEEALEKLDISIDICNDPELNYKNRKKLVKHLGEMLTYIDNNQMMIPNYGERYRYGVLFTNLAP